MLGHIDTVELHLVGIDRHTLGLGRLGRSGLGRIGNGLVGA